ncbi:hypothetical protein C7H19_14350 [Aphanothece hegewaldii CCALA 016]|uniref:Uncharacterized protein n=1 Tax=Aphanothece hegewaldii CCALA 016 TaxID=2107694 RepID=A0A2T1LW88_9CHRO|nr:hypothetical protein [Aphanothece hegewaldii]PSF36174.1 hypothetical protein C7H19_14350 [Aphanothece hegewaldii CCALA 016]
MDSMLLRAGKLKEALTDFVFDAEGELAVALETFSAEQMATATQQEMNQRNLLVDRFIFEGKVGQKTPIALFIEHNTDLSQEDQQLIQRWHKSFIGLFEIIAILDDGFELMNWTTAKHYIVKPNNPKILESMKRYKIGEILLTQIAPVDDYWMFSSPCTTLGRLGKPKLAVAIGNFKQNYGNHLYSDAPDLLEQAWKSVEKSHQDFINFFGSDEITLPGYQLNQKFAEYQNANLQEKLEASGLDGSKTIQDLAQEAGISSDEIDSIAAEMGVDATALNSNKITKMVQPKLELPPHLKKAEQVTAFSHPRWGQSFLANYSEFKKSLLLEDEQSVKKSEGLVMEYLKSSEISFFVWEKLVTQYSKQIESLLQKVLNSPNFDLEIDLKSLMKEFKKPIEPVLPESASVPIHLHTLFQDAVMEVNKDKSKNKSSKKTTNKGF